MVDTYEELEQLLVQKRDYAQGEYEKYKDDLAYERYSSYMKGRASAFNEVLGMLPEE